MEREPTVADMMIAYAEDAVDHARAASGVALDYSPESIRNVEAVLQTLYAALPKGFLGRLLRKAPSAQDLDTMCKMYGGYLGEVFRRAGGGEWAFDTEVSPWNPGRVPNLPRWAPAGDPPAPDAKVSPGQTVICLRKGDAKVFPPAKVFKRLTNGPEDDVWMYSQVIMKDWK